MVGVAPYRYDKYDRLRITIHPRHPESSKTNIRSSPLSKHPLSPLHPQKIINDF
jgi:hypothetical protein